MRRQCLCVPHLTVCGSWKTIGSVRALSRCSLILYRTKSGRMVSWKSTTIGPQIKRFCSTGDRGLKKFHPLWYQRQPPKGQAFLPGRNCRRKWPAMRWSRWSHVAPCVCRTVISKMAGPGQLASSLVLLNTCIRGTRPFVRMQQSQGCYTVTSGHRARLGARTRRGRHRMRGPCPRGQ